MINTANDLGHLSQRFNLPLRYLEAASELIVQHGYPDRMRLEDFVTGPWARHIETISVRTAEARGFFVRRMQHRVHVEVLPTLALGLQRVNNTMLCRMPARSEMRSRRLEPETTA